MVADERTRSKHVVRKSVSAAVLLFVSSLAIGCLIGLLLQRDDPRATAGRANADSTDVGEESFGSSTLSPHTGTRRERVENPVPLAQSSTAVNGGRTEHASSEPATPTGPTSVTIFCVDGATGEPVAGLLLNCRIMSHAPDAPAVRVLRDHNERTRAGGRLEISHEAACWLRIEVVDEQWSGSVVIHRMLGRGELELKVYEAGLLHITATYQDGIPVTSMGSLVPLDPSGEPIRNLHLTFALSEDGTSQVAKVPRTIPLSCKLFSDRRAGYDNYTTTLSVSQLSSGRVYIVVPPGEAKSAALRVEFVEGRPGFEGILVLQLERPQFSLSTTVRRSFRATSEFVEITPLPGESRCRASILGSKTWRSDWVNLVVGKTTLLRAECTASCVVRARILSPDGAPIRNAVLRISDGTYSGYTHGGVPSNSVGALSDSEGNVVLAGVPSGVVDIEAEGWQKELVCRTVELVPGQEINLGDLTLEEAQGRVSVVLVGMRDGYEYAVSVSKPTAGGSPIRPRTKAVDGKAAFVGLPLRSYSIAASCAQGGIVVSQTVELSSQLTSATIELDVSGLEPMRLRPARE